MRIQYPKLHNMTHNLSLSVSLLSKELTFVFLLDALTLMSLAQENIQCIINIGDII